MASACDHCHLNNHIESLKKMGERTSGFDFTIALAGNPNTGKSTVFNYLTGLRQHTGNWPGKTVTTAEGSYGYLDNQFKVVDLPGTYSLLSTSDDEEVARDFILFGEPDVTVIVVDASRLERNLNLVIQILEITDKAVLCLNLMDEARRHEIEIDQRTLARDLGIPVVATSARSGEGMGDLLQTIYDLAHGKLTTSPHRIQSLSPSISEAVEKISDRLLSLYPNLKNSRWIAMRVLEGDNSVIEALQAFENNRNWNGGVSNEQSNV